MISQRSDGNYTNKSREDKDTNTEGPNQYRVHEIRVAPSHTHGHFEQERYEAYGSAALNPRMKMKAMSIAAATCASLPLPMKLSTHLHPGNSPTHSEPADGGEGVRQYSAGGSLWASACETYAASFPWALREGSPPRAQRGAG